jgi:hypothetical protein
LPHGLNRSDGAPEPDGPASVDGSIGGGAAMREGVNEVSGVVVLSANGPWGWPHGPMEILAVRWVTGV